MPQHRSFSAFTEATRDPMHHDLNMEEEQPKPQTPVGRDDHRPFDGSSEVAEIDRLARYVRAGSAGWAADGSSLLPVSRGQLTAVERVYVFVHGWQPGSRATADLVFATEGDVVHAWDERVENTAGLTMVEQYLPLLDALAERDPEAAVLWFSWVDQSATDLGLFAARDSLRHTEANGRRLAIALSRAIGDGQPQIHLIGHSHGCVVATHAANSLSAAPEHVTLLDCPENWFSRAGGAAGLLGDILVRLVPGRGEGRTFVDAYATVFGSSYHERPGLGAVVDVRLAPPLAKDSELSAVSAGHQFPVAWYAGTVRDPDSTVGWSWSPLRGGETNRLGSSYVGSAAGKLREGLRFDPLRQKEAGVRLESLELPAITLTRAEPDALLALSLPPDAIAVEFDYRLRRVGRDTRLLGAVNRRLAFIAASGADVPEYGRYLRIERAGEGEALIQFRLDDPGLLGSAVVSGLRVVRTSTRQRNYTDADVSRSFLLIGAVGGAVGTVAAIGVAKLAVRLARAFG